MDMSTELRQPEETTQNNTRKANHKTNRLALCMKNMQNCTEIPKTKPKLKNAIGYHDLCQGCTMPPLHNGSRDVINHMTIQFPICHSYGCSVVTKSLSPAISEILGPKHIR